MMKLLGTWIAGGLGPLYAVTRAGNSLSPPLGVCVPVMPRRSLLMAG